jgi:hypothetical protein
MQTLPRSPAEYRNIQDLLVNATHSRYLAGERRTQKLLHVAGTQISYYM